MVINPTAKGLMTLAECDSASLKYNPVERKLVMAYNDANDNYNISTMEQWWACTAQQSGLEG
jgi:hypothetical protein